MRRKAVCAVLGICVLLAAAGNAFATPPADDLIAVSFSMLEEGNPFIARFEWLSCRKVEVLFPQGIPYLFGCWIIPNWMMRDYPDYQTTYGLARSNYFRVEKQYFYGTDCTGFIRYVKKESGGKYPPAYMENMMYDSRWQPYHVFDNLTEKEVPPIKRWKDLLEVGDYLIVEHQGARYRHIALYIGTLADYGYTAEDEPELADYLDYPLVIHCGLSPVYGERFQELIDLFPEKYGQLTTTDGGVQISIVGVDKEKTPAHIHVQQTDYDYFEMQDGFYWLTNIALEDGDAWCWFRQGE